MGPIRASHASGKILVALKGAQLPSYFEEEKLFACEFPGKPHVVWSGNCYQLSMGSIGALHASGNILVALKVAVTINI